MKRIAIIVAVSALVLWLGWRAWREYGMLWKTFHPATQPVVPVTSSE